MIEVINIPKGTRYISQYPEIEKQIIKPFPILINKEITGCGFSSYFLNKDVFKEPVILCSPRKFMIRSKTHNPNFSYLIEWRPEKMEKSSIQKLKERLKMIIESRLIFNEPPKIITTYDSFHYVKEVLQEMKMLDDFRIIVDEQQSIIKDSAFKGNTIKNFLKELNGLNKVIYLSATPTPKIYNDRIPILKDIYTIVLNWCKDDLRKINFRMIPLKQKETFTDIVRKYKDKYDKDGYFKKKTVSGIEHFSRELCIYVSNIEIIIHIIKALNLTNENTDVICSENEKTVKKLYDKTRKSGIRKSGFKPAKPKQINEPHKTFTFITRCSYEGADFYSTNATTIILSNPSIDCMSVDIGIDLNQIIGRERLESNVFRDDITLFTQVQGKFKSFEEMRKYKLNNSQKLLQFIDSNLVGSLKLDFTNDYLELDEFTNNPQISEMRMLCEDYSESVRLDQFKGDKYVFKTFNEGDYYNNKLNDSDLDLLNRFYSNFNIQFSFMGKMELLCNFLDQNPQFKYIIQNNSNLPQNYYQYYELLGTKIIKACLFREDMILEKINILKSENSIKSEIYKAFKVGDSIEVGRAKEILNDIYKQLNLKKKAKSTDLNQYFNISDFSKRIKSVKKRLVRIDGIKM